MSAFCNKADIMVATVLGWLDHLSPWSAEAVLHLTQHNQGSGIYLIASN